MRGNTVNQTSNPAIFDPGERVLVGTIPAMVTRMGRRPKGADGYPMGPRVYWLRYADGALDCLPDYAFRRVS
jgi:hypothetical protein